MLWYGYIYYVIFNIIVISFVIFFLRLFIWNLNNQFQTSGLITQIFVPNILFFFFITFTTLHYLLDYYQDLIYVVSASADLNFVNVWFSVKLINITAVSLNLIEVYFFPFIYVFLLLLVVDMTVSPLTRTYIIITTHTYEHKWTKTKGDGTGGGGTCPNPLLITHII